MANLRFSTEIACSNEAVFDLVADLPNYGKWLQTSTLFAEVMQISDNPIKLGTTYVDQGQNIPLRGEITEFQRPAHITFRQRTQSKLIGLPFALDLQIRYSLAGVGNGTQVIRDLTLNTHGIFKLVQPVLIRRIRKENLRILASMKAYLEKSPTGTS